MREAIGGAWLFGLVITFIVFFASFLAISINYSRAFNVKNNVVDLVEKYEGNNANARKKIGNYMSDVGYLVTGPCPKKSDKEPYDYKGYDLEGNEIRNGNAYFCISKDSTEDTELESGKVLPKQYYRVIVFFRIDLPVVGRLTTFKIRGETESVYFPENN